MRSLLLLLVLTACDDDRSGAPDAACKEDFAHFKHCPAPGCDGARDGLACSTPGLFCDLDFERGCSCLEPDRRWLCCGGAVVCPSGPPAEHSPCCGITFYLAPPCSYGRCEDGDAVDCRCIDNHQECTPRRCAADGAAD